MNIRRASAPYGVAVFMLMFWAPGCFASEQITCESNGGKKHYCSMEGGGWARLSRQLSHADCREGRDWGTTGRDIWVDHGCRATFEVSSHGGRHHNSYDDRYDDRNDRHSSSHDAKVAAGVVAGAALLGAIIYSANKSHSADQQTHSQPAHTDGYHPAPGAAVHVPGWMVGTFDGYNAKYKADVRMTIAPNGRMSAFAEGQTFNGTVDGNAIYVSGAMFNVRQTSDGFTTYQQGDTANQVRYRRIH